MTYFSESSEGESRSLTTLHTDLLLFVLLKVSENPKDCQGQHLEPSSSLQLRTFPDTLWPQMGLVS